MYGSLNFDFAVFREILGPRLAVIRNSEKDLVMIFLLYKSSLPFFLRSW